MPGSPVCIGIDAGTSVVKVAAFAEAGPLVATAIRPLALHHPRPAWVEQDQHEVLAAVEAALAEVVGAVAGRTVRMVAVTGQGDGCWLTGRDGRPVGPAISWMDGRAADLVAGWTAAGVSRQVFADQGTALFPGASAAILAWLDRHEPARLDAARTAGHLTDVLLERMTGLRATDPTNAVTGLGPTGSGHRADLLPPVRLPLPAAPLRAPLAGLPAGIPVVAAPFDIPACGIGAGVAQVGDGLLILGTTLACGVLRGRPETAGPPLGTSVALPDGSRLRLFAAMAGTAGLDWAMSLLGLTFDHLDDVLADSPPGAHGVEVLPYLAPSGERAPFLDAAARAQFGGLSITTTRSDLIRGLCEGLAFSARACFDRAGPTGPVYACGGGSRSRTWLTIMASTLDRPVHPCPGGHVGARGAVLAGAEAAGLALDRRAWVPQADPVLPVAADVALYQDRYRRFQAQLAAARPLWAR